KWVAMGPVPGAGGSGCSNPTNGEGKLIYNHTHNTMQYCDGTNWIAIGDYAKDFKAPEQIPGLALWLYAAHASPITIATGVSQWSDKSGKGNHMTQATGNAQPLHVANTLNGYPVVHFDGSNDRLVASTITNMSSMTGFTLFAVQNRDFTTTNRDAF